MIKTRITCFGLVLSFALLNSGFVHAAPVEFSLFTSPGLVNKAFFGSDVTSDVNDIFLQGDFTGNIEDTDLAVPGPVPVGGNTIGAASYYIAHFYDGTLDGVFSNATNLFDNFSSPTASFFSTGWIVGENVGGDGNTVIGANPATAFSRRQEIYFFETGLQPGTDIDGVFPPNEIVLDPDPAQDITTFAADNTLSFTGQAGISQTQDPNGYTDTQTVLSLAGWYVLNGQSPDTVLPAFSDITLGFVTITRADVVAHMDYLITQLPSDWEVLTTSVLAAHSVPDSGVVIRNAAGSPLDINGMVVAEGSPDAVPFPELEILAVYSSFSNDPRAVPGSSASEEVNVPLPAWAMICLAILFGLVAIGATRRFS